MDYIYTSKSLSSELCKKIIKYFDESDNKLKYGGLTYSGLDKRIKDTTDILIPNKNNQENKWDEINDILSSELEIHLKKYVNILNDKKNFCEENNYGVKFNHLFDDLYLINNFMIQRYEKNEGKYVYHDDNSIDLQKYKQRVLTYLWYLNDVDEGGETEFFGGNFKIKPEEGKLLFFPATWTFPHRGNKPISSHKYIITGWIYKDFKKSTNYKTHIPIIAEPIKIKITNHEEIKKDILKNNIINENDITNNKIETFNIKTTTNEIISVTKNYIDLLFDYFYKKYQNIFDDYKNYLNSGESFIQDITLEKIFTDSVCRWLLNEVNENVMPELWNKNFNSESRYIELNICSNILPFLISSFQIIVDITKFRYNIDKTVNFNIKKWFLYECVSSDNFIEDLKIYDSDLVFQIVLKDNNDWLNGKTFVSKKIKYYPDMKYILVFFVDFSFLYFNGDIEKINISLKELVDISEFIKKE